jgi:phosphoribosylformylglycinamidine cyclo-ligase
MRYRDTGVDAAAAGRAKAQIRQLARRTFNPRVLGDVGGFGGFFSLAGLPPNAVLVSSMDGVGTKLKIASIMNRHASVGADLVNHSVNDISVHGARPLFFLDYLAAGKLRPRVVAEVVRGITEACRAVGCALIGGETAEMPGFYPEDEYDLAGCMVGWGRRNELLDGRRIRLGDMIMGLPSAGLHTNGYSMARKILLEKEGIPVSRYLPELGRRLGDELLQPHRCYWPVVEPLLAKRWLSGLVHITGGGITANTPRILPRGCGAEIRLGAWQIPPIFRLIERCGRVPLDEMFRTFNMGLGMLLIVPQREAGHVAEFLKKRKESFCIVGRIVRGRPKVEYVS